jgi:hypothetical protein
MDRCAYRAFALVLLASLMLGDARLCTAAPTSFKQVAPITVRNIVRVVVSIKPAKQSQAIAKLKAVPRDVAGTVLQATAAPAQQSHLLPHQHRLPPPLA